LWLFSFLICELETFIEATVDGHHSGKELTPNLQVIIIHFSHAYCKKRTHKSNASRFWKIPLVVRSWPNNKRCVYNRFGPFGRAWTMRPTQKLNDKAMRPTRRPESWNPPFFQHSIHVLGLATSDPSYLKPPDPKKIIFRSAFGGPQVENV
jgi:hypothetical protein